MRILLGAQHRYPAFRVSGCELKPTPMSSGSSQHVHDLLARGLAELGHEVFYLLPQGTEDNLPSSVKRCSVAPVEVDVAHGIAGQDSLWRGTRYRIPFLATSHCLFPKQTKGENPNDPNWVFSSRYLMNKCSGHRFVYNGIDPDGYVFRAEKEDYLLFLAALDHPREKGLNTALQIAEKAGRTLVVAGGAAEAANIQEIKTLCEKHGAKYVGDMRGRAKASLIAGAKALLHTSTQSEGGPLVIPEALISGTPVLALNTGACAELLSAECGALCSAEKDWLKALDELSKWDPATCRRTALTRFHYLRMARDYVPIYRHEINRFRDLLNQEAGEDNRDDDDVTGFSD